MSRIPEAKLVLPALFLMSKQSNGEITTTNLIKELGNLLPLTEEDLLPNSSRKDSRFSQIVRNLKSHKTFEKYGYAEEINDGFRITSLGKDFVNAKIDVIKYLFLSDDMDFIDISNSCDEILVSEPRRIVIPLTETIREGRTFAMRSLIYERSYKLRQLARDYFSSINGILYCDCCNYEYSHYHTSPYNQSCIEIHHKKPLYLYEDADIEQTFQDALNNLMPVCPNCHRLIHKNKISVDQLDLFKSHCHQFTY